MLLRGGHALEKRVDRGQQVGGGDPPIHRRGLAGVSIARRPEAGLRGREKDHVLQRLLHRQLSHELGGRGGDPGGEGMKADLDEILRQAMTLPPEQRAALAGSLLESLDEEVDEDAEVAWKAEIQRRMQELDSGSVTPITLEEFERRISKRLNAR